jgi:phosphate transport system substrate-binding protein
MERKIPVQFLATTMIALLLILQACQSSQPKTEVKSDKLKGNISISGAFALYPMTVRWAEEFMKLNPDVRIDISAGGAGKGMTDALAGMVHLAMVSREISPEEIAQGAWYIAVTKDAVLPTMNSDNPGKDAILKAGMTPEMFREIYLSGKKHTWKEFFEFPDESAIDVYTRSDACGAAEMWGKFLGKNQESLLGIGVFGDPGIADAVKNDKYGVGYNNVIYAYDINTRQLYEGIEIIPLDLNGDRVIGPEEQFYASLDSIMHAIQQGRYPSPPARALYFVSKGKPNDPAVIAFIEWILTEGQAYVGESGYVGLPDEKIKAELAKIK